MGKKYLLLLAVAGALSLFAVNVAWALTAYVTGADGDNAYAVDPSTIQDGASGHRTADVYDVQSDYYVHIAKTEFDCAGRHVQTVSEKVYTAEENGLNFDTDLGGDQPADVTKGTMLDGIFTFVCGWPQVSSDAVKVEPDAADLPHLVIYLSNAVMNTKDGSDSK